MRLPVLLPGEDRGFESGLFVDLVPASCWFTNVRTCIAPSAWDRLRRMVYGRAGQRCEACGAGPDPASGRRLEAHERWAYDDATGVQRLRHLICLCSWCHAVTHFGLTAVRGREEWALAHLQAVTGLDLERAVAHVNAAFALWQRRSARGVDAGPDDAHRRRDRPGRPAGRGGPCGARRADRLPAPSHRQLSNTHPCGLVVAVDG